MLTENASPNASTKKLTAAEVRAVAVIAMVHPRSIERFLAGRRPRGDVGRRIETALAQYGVAPVETK